MNTPKFKVGEEVILQSKGYLEYNGEYIVESVFTPNQTVTDRISGLKSTNMSNCFVYRFTQILKSKKKENVEISFLESALRKKYKPSEVSFSELMTSLNQPIKID